MDEKYELLLDDDMEHMTMSSEFRSMMIIISELSWIMRSKLHWIMRSEFSLDNEKRVLIG